MAIEPLESRTLLSGNVSARIINDHLYLFGDSLGNTIEIRGDSFDARSLTITPGDDDTTINGLPDPVSFSGFGGHVIIRMGAGTDRVHISGADMAKDLRIELGDGSDRFTSSNTLVHRNLLILGEAGFDYILPTGLRVFRASQIQGNAGDDAILFAGCRFSGRAEVLGGDGNDTIDRLQTVFAGGARIDGGPGSDGINSRETIEQTYDFRHGRRGWRSGFADWRRADRSLHEFIAEPRALPTETGATGQAFLLSGDNRTDDLFMFMTTAIQASGSTGTDGPAYMAQFEIEFASNAVTGGFGVGGSPGNSVYLKAGASSEAPSIELDDQGIYRLNLDMGHQASGGQDLSVVSTIANGLHADDLEDPEKPPYRLVRKVHTHTTPVTPGSDGKIHLTVGIDSGFEATTAVFIRSVRVRLVPFNTLQG